MNSRVCYFGLAKACLALRYPAGRQAEGQGRSQTQNRLPLPLLPAFPAHRDRLEAQHVWQVGFLVLCVLKIKISACLFFGGQREPHQFPRGGFSGGERVISPVPRFHALCGHTLGLSSGSGLPVPRRRNCISISTVKGWLWSRELRYGPGYMASGPGGSLKSLAADMSLLMCLSSVMPAS